MQMKQALKTYFMHSFKYLKIYMQKTHLDLTVFLLHWTYKIYMHKAHLDLTDILL